MGESEEVSRAIYAEQLRLLYAALPLSIIVTLFNSVILVLVLWPVVEHHFLLIWLTVMAVVMVIRALIFTGYKRRRDENQDRHWTELFTFGTLSAALVWTAAILFLFPAESEYQFFLGFIIGGMSAGAVTSLSYQRSSFLAYMPLLLIPLAIRFFIEGGTIQLAMAAMVIAFMVVVLTASGRIYRDSRENIAMRFEAIQMQRALRQSEGKYQHIFDSVPLGIAHFNDQGRILDSNNKFAELAGKHSPSPIEWNLIKDSPDNTFSEAVAVAMYEGSSRYEGKASVIGGSEDIEVRVYLGAVKDGDEVHEGVAIIEDVTEDKRVDKAKNEFVSSVSHELRTPLTSIVAVLKLIENGKLDTAKEASRKMIEIAVRNSERLLSLINDLLDMRSIETGELGINSAACPVVPIIKKIVEEMYPFAQKHDVALQLQTTSMDKCIYVDEGRYMQVLANLLSNAIKFSPAGTEVVVSLALHEKNVRVSVKDSGPGIPEEFQSELFKRFTQYDASDTKSAGGSGLGLNITSELARLMGGTLGYETSDNNGTIFFIDFPVVEC